MECIHGCNLHHPLGGADNNLRADDHSLCGAPTAVAYTTWQDNNFRADEHSVCDASMLPVMTDGVPMQRTRFANDICKRDELCFLYYFQIS